MHLGLFHPKLLGHFEQLGLFSVANKNGVICGWKIKPATSGEGFGLDNIGMKITKLENW